MKPHLFILLIISLLFTACKEENKAKPFIKISKEEYIQRANKGDIKAMVALQNHFCFIETKEGLELYKKWYKTINKDNEASDILQFTRIFSNYRKMFINGESKYKHLLSLLKGYASKSQVENPKEYLEEKKIKKILKEYHTAYIYKDFKKSEALKKELLSTKRGKKALANFYFHNDKKSMAYDLFEELATQEDDIDSIVTLAIQTYLQYPFNEEINKISEKWQEHILKSNNRKLIQEAKEKLKTSYISKDDAKNEKAHTFLYKIAEDKLLSENIIVLRQIFEKKKRTKTKEAISSLEKAYSYGDIYSAFALAQFYETRENKTSFLKAEKIYQDLSNKGDVDAKIALATLYLEHKNFKNIDKAIKIYEGFIKENSPETLSFALRKLQNLYLYEQNYKKAFPIMQKLIKLRDDANDYTIIAWMYHKGKGTNKNLQKAKEYYETAIQKGDETAKKYLEELNKTIQKGSNK